MRARVLYIEPITKFVYLTLRGIEKVPRQSLDIGQIINAQVQKNCNEFLIVYVISTIFLDNFTWKRRDLFEAQ